MKQLVALLILLLPVWAVAQLHYFFQPVDSILRIELPVQDVDVLVFGSDDSTKVVVNGGVLTIKSSNDIRAKECSTFDLPAKRADYNVYVDAEGYVPRTFAIHTEPNGNRFNDLGKLALLRTPKQLDELTVVTTKIKLYYRGDTLVYNADAFNLPNGSMLSFGKPIAGGDAQRQR